MNDALKELSSAGASLDVDPAGRVLQVTAAPGSTLGGGAKDDAFVRRYAAALGVPNGSGTRRVGSTGVGDGTVVHYQQEVNGVPVLGGEVLVSTDSAGRVVAAAAETVSSLPTVSVAKVTADNASSVALATAARLSGVDTGPMRAAATLWLYDPRVIGAPGRAELRPTWWVKVTGPDADAMASVLVDGLDGSVSLAISEHESADRIVCDLANTRVNTSDLNAYACNAYSASGLAPTTRREGQPPSAVAEVNRAYDYLGATIDFYQNAFGRNSYDGKGAQAKATVRLCRTNPLGFVIACPYPNAYWNDYQLVFGEGFVTDDVVAHEFAHAVTSHSSQLFYAYQAGAINEALSDIMGELVDQAYAAPGEDTSRLWLVGEDLPPDSLTGIREVRDMASPNRLGQPSSVYGLYWSYASPNSASFDNGGVHTNSGPANFAAYLISHGGTANGYSVAGIGLTKSAQLWYRVMHQLTSGADYRALGRALVSACTVLVGHGLSQADCTQVIKAAAATGMRPGDPSQCLPSQATEQPAFVDDFEKQTGWVLTTGTWQYLPSADVPVRYAYSGKSALYGYAVGTQVGYAEMASPVAVPDFSPYSTGYLFLRTVGFAGQLAVEYNAGSSWQPLAAVNPSNDGYVSSTVALASLEGQTVRLRFKLTGGASSGEWLVDDVMIGACNSTIQGEPRYVSGDIVGSTGTVSWEATTIPQMHFEISYDPPVPGAPTQLPAVAASGTYTYGVSVPGLDPAKTYRISVVQVNDAYNGRTRPVDLILSASVPPNCPTAPPQFQVIWSPTKPAQTGAGGCAAIPDIAPRRSN